MNQESGTDFLIYPYLSGDNRLCLGVRSVDFNANCCVRIQLHEDVVSEILNALNKAQKDMVSAVKQGNLIKDIKCKLCVVDRGICTICGKDYR
jgi:hypothetical protein